MEYMMNLANRVDFYFVLIFWIMLFLFVIGALSRNVYSFFRKLGIHGVVMVLYVLLIMIIFGTPVWVGISVYLAIKDVVWAGIACIIFMQMTVIGGGPLLIILNNYLASHKGGFYG